MTGWFLGENIHLTCVIIDECEMLHQNGLIILVDFEKTFDPIDSDSIKPTLEHLNFGPNIIRWVEKLQIGSK